MGDRGHYVTARVHYDEELAAARDAAARGRVERWFGCRCTTTDTNGEHRRWADHGTDPHCPAGPDLDLVLEILGFTPTRYATAAAARAGNDPTHAPRSPRTGTGTGRWPTDPKGG